MDDSMIRFLKTNRLGTGRGAHHHIVYLNEESLIGAMSTDNKHTHEIRWVPPIEEVPEQQDPQTGQIIPGSPGQPGYWEVLPVNNHTHELEEYVVEEESSPTKDETKEVGEVITAYKECKEYEQDSVDNGTESYGFYEGPGQWTDEQRTKLTSQQRACLVINKIKPQMNTLFSYQLEQRSDWKFYPQEEGDARIAELASIVVKNISYQCRYNNEETRAFKDAAIVGRGILGSSFDTSRSVRGDIIVDRRKWDETFFGPHEREDATDAQVACNVKWYSKDKVKALWPDKAPDIQGDWDALQISTKGANFSDDEYKHPGKNINLSFDLVNISKKELKVVECWRKEWKMQQVGVQSQDEYTLNISNWDSDDIEAINTIPGCKVIKQRMCQARKTVIAGTTLLEDQSPADIPPIDGRCDYFPLVPIYCYKDESGGFSSIVDVAKDPQREVNKRHSQTVDIINQMASYGYWYDSSTFEDTTDEKKFRETGMRAGFMQKLAQLERKPIKEEGVKFPGELVQMIQFEDTAIQQTMNVVAQPYGANESGAMLLQKQRMKMAGNEFLFENLRQARFLIAKMILAYVQKHYSPQRIYRLVQNSADKDKARIGGRPASEYSEEEIVDMLQNQDLTRLDLVIDDVQWSPSIRLANLAIYGELAKQGQFPPEMLVMMNDTLPSAVKDQIIETMQAQQEAAAQAEQQKMQMEIGKTMIAKKGDNQAAAISSQDTGAPPAQMAQEQLPLPASLPAIAPVAGTPAIVPGAPCPVCGEIAQPMMPMPMSPSSATVDVNVNVSEISDALNSLSVAMSNLQPVRKTVVIGAPDANGVVSAEIIPETSMPPAIDATPMPTDDPDLTRLAAELGGVTEDNI
jgi:hypothetical protein